MCASACDTNGFILISLVYFGGEGQLSLAGFKVLRIKYNTLCCLINLYQTGTLRDAFKIILASQNWYRRTYFLSVHSGASPEVTQIKVKDTPGVRSCLSKPFTLEEEKTMAPHGRFMSQEKSKLWCAEKLTSPLQCLPRWNQSDPKDAFSLQRDMSPPTRSRETD
jgi:hypothetical protein